MTALNRSIEEPTLLQEMQARFKSAHDHASKWREEAREAYRFYAGHQWDDEDMARLEEQQRPAIVFNRTGTLIDAVLGHENNNRSEVRYIPRTQGDAAVNEVLTEVSRFFLDQCDGDHEESDAFRDCLISGMGWTCTRLSDEHNPEYDLIKERIDPIEMIWDPSSKKPNLADARYVFRIKWMDHQEVRSIWPDWAGIEGDADFSVYWDDDDVEPNDANPRNQYQDPAGSKGTGKDVPVIEYQWRDTEPEFIVQNPNTGEQETLDLEDFYDNQEEIDQAELPYTMKRKTTYRRAFAVGNQILQEDAPYPRGFTYDCMTGKRDREKGYWFGIVRSLLDPQRWSNKWLSQILHIINSNAKGGIMFERDAVTSIHNLEREWADPRGLVELNEGAISKGKIMEKPMGQYPVGVERLMEYANQSFGDVSGVNAELLGLADREQPGVLEWQRKQSAVTLLAPLFDSLTRYRKQFGKGWLYFIQNYVSDGRLVRIVQDDQEQYVPLIKEQFFDPNVAEYDVIVDQAATSPNMKEATWAVLTTLLPSLRDILGPEEIQLALEYSPLPDSFMAKLKEKQEQRAQQPQPPDPELVKVQAQIQAQQAKQQGEQQLAQQEFQFEVQSEKAKMQAEFELKRDKMRGELLLKAAEASGQGGKANGKAPQIDFSEIFRNNEELASALRDIAAQVLTSLNRPKQIIRGDDGRAIGVQ